MYQNFSVSVKKVKILLNFLANQKHSVNVNLFGFAAINVGFGERMFGCTDGGGSNLVDNL